MRYIVTDYNIRIFDSFYISKKEFKNIFTTLLSEYSNNPVLLNRSWCHMSLEWCCHNFLYKLGIKREHTKDVDFEYPQKWYMKVLYAVCGVLCWIFTK